MVNSARRTGLACALALLGLFSVHARDFATWHIGDVASQDVTTPVVLDVVDAQATAASRAEALVKTPAIFRINASTSNTMVLKVTAALTEAHDNFLTSLKQQYQSNSLAEKAVQSADFTNFVAAFNRQNKKILITTSLATQWAQGENGLDLENSLIEMLLQTTDRPIRPDAVPDDFQLGETVRLVPVRTAKDTLNLDKVEQRGTIVSLSSVTTVTRLRGLFRRDFSKEDQLFARSVATYIHPNAELDTNLTQQAREHAISQVGVVASHYAAGQIIAKRGQVIDARTKAALTQLNELLPPEPASQPTPPTVKISEPPVQTPKPSVNQNLWPAVAIAVISIVALLVWLLAFRRRSVAVTVPALPAELAPQIAQMLKLAVVQELAEQRRELLLTQQSAAGEVVRLMERLNELHAPSQERLAAYERRILELETELSVRTEENRELLKLKIDLLRQQIETERGARRVDFN